MKNTSKEQLRDLLGEWAKKHAGEIYESGDNVVVAWEQMSEEDGVPICKYWWAVAHFHSPTFTHQSLFSYPILSYPILRERFEDPDPRETLSLVAKRIAPASFTEPKIA